MERRGWLPHQAVLWLSPAAGHPPNQGGSDTLYLEVASISPGWGSVPRLPAPFRYCHHPNCHARSPGQQSLMGTPAFTSSSSLHLLKQLRELGGDALEHIHLLQKILQSIQMKVCRERCGEGDKHPCPFQVLTISRNFSVLSYQGSSVNSDLSSSCADYISCAMVWQGEQSRAVCSGASCRMCVYVRARVCMHICVSVTFLPPGIGQELSIIRRVSWPGGWWCIRTPLIPELEGRGRRVSVS